MTHSTISAEPEKLYHYATRSRELDEALICRAGELEGRLSHFEQRCTEPGFQVVASPSAAPVRDHGRESQALAERVRQVGRRFAQADALRIGRRSRLQWLDVLRRLVNPRNVSLIVEHALLLILIVKSPPWLRRNILKFFSKRQEGEASEGFEVNQPVEESTISSQVRRKKVRAEQVKPDEARRTHGEATAEKGSDVALYPRGPSQGKDKGTSVFSNCTWYAAAAIFSASNGRIDLNSGQYGEEGEFSRSLGHAYLWAEHARAAIDSSHPEHARFKQYEKNISSVDRRPRPGSVICFPKGDGMPKGHVAFVEEAELVEVDGQKQWKLIISEENWGGSKFSDAKPVEVPGHPKVKRWRRTIYRKVADEKDKSIAENQEEFIHFKLDDSHLRST